jgi:pyruvate ferredoxin oxidoreductase beta subunit
MTSDYPTKLADLPKEERSVSSGHRLCTGCAAGTIARLIGKAVEQPLMWVNATCCLEVATTIYPFAAWNIPWIHNAFENAAATASGVRAGLDMLMKKGRIPQQDTEVIAIGGDGGTYDIGIQAISGAIERGHDFLYICYDNEAYMNTGIQRSGATMHAAWTTTSPAGEAVLGKKEFKKPLLRIIAAHGLEYAATASVAYPLDFVRKVKRGVDVKGPAFVHVIQPCLRGWRFDTSESFQVARLAVESRFFPLYEVFWGYKYVLNYPDPKAPKVPIEEYLKQQGRLRHLFKPQRKQEIIDILQEHVDKEWQKLLELAEFSEKSAVY